VCLFEYLLYEWLGGWTDLSAAQFARRRNHLAVIWRGLALKLIHDSALSHAEAVLQPVIS
jgi:hypothetical protein